MSPLSVRSVDCCRTIARAVGGALGVLGLAVFAGWLFNAAVLKSLIPGWAAMKPNTAAALLLSAGAVWRLADKGPASRRDRWFVRLAAGSVVCLGALTFAQSALAVNLGVDGLIFNEAGWNAPPWPGRMSSLAAMSFVLLGSASFVIAGPLRPASIWFAQLISLAAAFGAFVAVTGYIYGRETLELAPFFTDTALHSSIALLALGVGIVCARPEAGLMALFNAASAGGAVLRQLLLPTVLLPVAMNWLGHEGERRRIFPPGFGWMLDAALTVVLTGLLVWIVARILHEKDLARQSAEAELRRSEERYRQLIEMSPVAIIVKDQRRIEFANPAARALVGATQADEVLGKSPFAFVHPDSRATFEKNFCRVLKDGTPLPPTEQRVLRLDGKEVEIEFSASAVDYHGQRFAQVVANDITERKLSARALRESEERFRLIAETVTEVFWMADVTLDRMVYVSPAYERVWGLSCASLYEKPRSHLDAIHPDDRGHVLANYDLKKDGIPFEHEYRVVRPDGCIRWVFDRGFPVRDAGGRVLHYVGVAQDITERKCAEQKLRLLAHAVESTNDMISITSLDDRFLFVNRAFLDGYGYTKDEVLGQTPAMLASVAEKPTALHRSIRDAAARQGWSGELLNRRKDGTVFPIRLSSSPVRDEHGKVVALMGLATDITERRRTEEHIRFQARLLDQVRNAVIATDADGRIVYWNNHATSIYQWTPGEVLGQLLATLLIPASEQKRATMIIEELQTAGAWEGEFTMRRKDGRLFPAYVVDALLKDEQGRITGIVGVSLDITERKLAEEILQASEARFRATFEQAAMGMMVAALDGRFLRVNGKFCAITGFSEKEILTKTFQQLTHADDLEFDIQQIRRLLAADTSTFSSEKRYVRNDGSLAWVDVTASLVRRKDGSPDYIIALVEDITQRRDLETQLRQTQKMEAIGQLAGGVAHDFNNMLTAIQGHATLLGMERALPPTARESLEEIDRAVQRAAGLTRQLLLFSRREVMQPTQLNLNDSIASIASMLVRLIGADVRIKLHLSPRPLRIYADSGMIDQVLMNLAVNARDAMPDGGDIIIETSESAIDTATALLAEAEPGRYACLSISDTGCGIPPEILSRIFEPFFTTKPAGKGTGLGLATVFGIVKQHHGWLKVHSETGRGTTFRVFIPLTELPSPDQRSAHRLSAPHGRGETVLLVEDDEAVREITGSILERHGYKVVAANSGADALRRYEGTDETIALLLTDLVMPGGVSGTELAGELRVRQPDLKVIFASGYSAEIAGRELNVHRGQIFLQKPFETSRLLRTIRQLLHGVDPG